MGAHPFLIDFGCAQPFPGGDPKRADFGSVDFNSIRSSEGGARGPYDDLESLGLVLCHGLFGDLPWFHFTKHASWENGKLLDRQRPVVCGQVQQAKVALLDVGWNSFGSSWAHLAGIPVELVSFLCFCRDQGRSVADGGTAFPDYVACIAILGGAGKDEAT